jgi:Mad3/BUB1 homology region 1
VLTLCWHYVQSEAVVFLFHRVSRLLVLTCLTNKSNMCVMICRYISWTEQNFPKGGSTVDELIKNCVLTFKDAENYFSDERYIKIWIKFVSTIQLCHNLITKLKIKFLYHFWNLLILTVFSISISQFHLICCSLLVCQLLFCLSCTAMSL